MRALLSYLFVAVVLAAPVALADQLLVSWGSGTQPDSDQNNQMYGVDYAFLEKTRSVRSKLTFGASYMHWQTDADDFQSMDVFSVYPQLTLTPVNELFGNSYFFVRALGPSYISSNQLGSRQQKNNFAFQAQVGVGYEWQLSSSESLMLQLSWKHLSNAELFQPNDGIDVPFVLSIGYER